MHRESGPKKCPDTGKCGQLTDAGASHRQIIKSTSLVGGSTVLSLLIGLARTKILAVLLGPSGVALFGLYASAVDLVVVVAGMGIQSSAVRQVAEVNSQGDPRQITRTVTALRRLTLVLGLLGALFLFVLRVPISRITFGDDAHSSAFGWLSISIFITVVSSGQMALIQGMRRIRDLATIKIIGAFFGLVVTVPIIGLMGESGVAPAMVAVTGSLLVVSWRFARRIPVEPVSLTWNDACREYKALIGLGLAFLVAGVATAGATYFIRSAIVEHLGLEAAGHYQAAFALSGMYVGIILSAMGFDFYPRLTAIATDNEACNRLVNEQSEVALLVAAPGIVATLALAPLIISVLYSAEFLPAVDVLRWQVLGLLGRIVSWPLGFVILAKGRGKIFAATEILTSIVHVLLVTFAMRNWGLAGTGMAFFALYLFYSVLMRIVVGSLSGFQWTSGYLKLLFTCSVTITAAFSVPLVMDPTSTLVLELLILTSLSVYSSYKILQSLGPGYVLRKIDTPLCRRVLGRFGR
jgi:antigen flippase